MVVQNLNIVSSTYGARLWPKPRFSTTSHNLELKLRHDQWLTLAHCLSRVRIRASGSDRLARALAQDAQEPAQETLHEPERPIDLLPTGQGRGLLWPEALTGCLGQGWTGLGQLLP